MLPSLALLGCLLGFAALWIGGAHDAYFALLRVFGVPAFRFPFLDTYGELAIVKCHQRGYDVYVGNPCDVLGRVHVYTPLWFRLAILPIDTRWTPMIGFGLALGFVTSLALLPPGRDGRAGALICAAVLSPAVAFAVERGNADLLMFVLAALAAGVALRRLPTRLLAFPLVVLAAALKVYPATLLVLALRERLALCLAAAAVSLVALLTYAAIDAAGLREMLAVVPGRTPFIYAFGARNLPLGLGSLFGWPPVVLAVVQAALLCAAFVFAARRLAVLRQAVGVLTPAETTFLLVGTGMIVGCFIVGQSGEYRVVHVLLVLPALTALAAAPGPARGLARSMVWVILLQLWGDVASVPLVRLVDTGAAGGAASGAVLMLWLTRELAWWWIVAALLGLLLAMVSDLACVAVFRRHPERLDLRGGDRQRSGP